MLNITNENKQNWNWSQQRAYLSRGLSSPIYLIEAYIKHKHPVSPSAHSCWTIISVNQIKNPHQIILNHRFQPPNYAWFFPSRCMWYSLRPTNKQGWTEIIISICRPGPWWYLCLCCLLHLQLFSCRTEGNNSSVFCSFNPSTWPAPLWEGRHPATVILMTTLQSAFLQPAAVCENFSLFRQNPLPPWDVFGEEDHLGGQGPHIWVEGCGDLPAKDNHRFCLRRVVLMQFLPVFPPLLGKLMRFSFLFSLSHDRLSA